MKKTICLLGLVFLTFAVSCTKLLPTVNESKAVSEGENTGESSLITESSGESSEESFESSEESLENSEETSESSLDETSEESEEESSVESSEVSEDQSVTGNLFDPYYQTIKSGKYMLSTTETKIIGGESVPYTVTAYHNNGVIYALIEESYGSVSEYIIKDGNLIILDEYNKTALIFDYDKSLFSEKTLWTGSITLTDSGTQKLFNTMYNYESYVDSAGFEFTLFFEDEDLRRYRSYNEKQKDTIVISLSVSDDISEGVFDIPDNFSITDARD